MRVKREYKSLTRNVARGRGGNRLPVVPNYLPQIPFRLMLVAPSGQGKTSLALDLLRDKNYRNIFEERIFVISSNYPYEKERWEFLNLIDSEDAEDKNVMFHYDPEWIQALRDAKEEHDKAEREEKGEKFRVPQALLIIEDVLEQLPHECKQLTALFTHGRLKGWNVMILTQKYNKISLTVRTNLTDMAMLGIPNVKERETIINENCDSMTVEDLMRMYEEVKRTDAYGYLWINKRMGTVHRGFSEETLNTIKASQQQQQPQEEEKVRF